MCTIIKVSKNMHDDLGARHGRCKGWGWDRGTVRAWALLDARRSTLSVAVERGPRRPPSPALWCCVGVVVVVFVVFVHRTRVGTVVPLCLFR